MDLIERARVFATAAHAAKDCRQKYTHYPYIVHPATVAYLVQSVPHDAGMVAAAWLHDVVEDTAITHDNIMAEFGADVAGLVFELTDTSKPSDGNRAARKAIDRARIAAASVRAQQVKLADLIDNTRTIVEHDPAFGRVYLAEKRQLLEVIAARGPLFDLAHYLAWRDVRPPGVQ